MKWTDGVILVDSGVRPFQKGLPRFWGWSASDSSTGVTMSMKKLFVPGMIPWGVGIGPLLSLNDNDNVYEVEDSVPRSRGPS